ncbi:MAG TPA: CoA ester lyase [Acidimicrobiales bacterium]|nr:CoA ester lyase [Acidimicrobiales bacterium]
MTGAPPPAVMLYAPAGEPAKAEKAVRLPTDAVILDLEDAVAPAAKPAARAWCARFLAEPAGGPERWVRVNDPAGPDWIDDVVAVTRPGLAGLVVPKVESAGQLARVDGALAGLERDRGMTPGAVRLIATIETPLGLRRAEAVASGSCRLATLGFGAGDLSRLAGLDYPAVEGGAVVVLDRARADLVLACARAGVHPPHDSVYGRYSDIDGLRREAVRARQMGFGGKHAIHPAQLAPLSECFAVTAAEQEQAARMVAAYDAAVADGLGAVGVDGILVDEPIAQRARRTLAAARSDRARP